MRCLLNIPGVGEEVANVGHFFRHNLTLEGSGGALLHVHRISGVIRAMFALSARGNPDKNG